jgi:hypothetical protein
MEAVAKGVGLQRAWRQGPELVRPRRFSMIGAVIEEPPDETIQLKYVEEV